MTWGLRKVSVLAAGSPALTDVDLTVGAGDVVAIVGGDGAGKTTLARVLVGLTEPHRGTVHRPPSIRIGYQSANSGVWPDMTVGENLEFIARVHRLSGADRRERIDRLVEATGLGNARGRLGDDLSGGMRQKLGVAMALLPAPALLVLDEPTTGVDPVSRTELWNLITAAAADGTAVVVTTTYLDEAERAKSILALEEGGVLAAGSPAEIAAAVQGVIVDVAGGNGRSWRRGREWRTWCPDGSVPVGARRIEPDMTDLLVAATLAAEARP